MTEKAYKLLAIQEKISNRAAKELIDKGVVYAQGKKIALARGEISAKTKFQVKKIEKVKKIFEDKKIIAIDKPAFITTEEIAKDIDGKLLHRLDKETSGVLLFTKDEDFHAQAVKAFKKREVKKEYIAVVYGKVIEPVEIDAPILTIKNNGKAHSRIDAKRGKEALSKIEPMILEGKRSKVKVTIETGRTHQIRVHLKSINASILGDTQYGGKPYERMMLHAYKISLLGYDFESKEPKLFTQFGN